MASFLVSLLPSSPYSILVSFLLRILSSLSSTLVHLLLENSPSTTLIDLWEHPATCLLSPHLAPYILWTCPFHAHTQSQFPLPIPHLSTWQTATCPSRLCSECFLWDTVLTSSGGNWLLTPQCSLYLAHISLLHLSRCILILHFPVPSSLSREHSLLLHALHLVNSQWNWWGQRYWGQRRG